MIRRGRALRLAQTELGHAKEMRGPTMATPIKVAQAEKAVTDAQTQVDTLRRQGVMRRVRRCRLLTMGWSARSRSGKATGPRLTRHC